MLVVAGVGVTARLLVAGHSSRQAGGPPYTHQNMSRCGYNEDILDTTIIFNIQVSVRGGLECGLSRGEGNGEKDSHVAIIISLGLSSLDLFLSNT